MKVILTKDHPTLGEEGTILEIADGYGRNFLLPRGLAYPATKHHIALMEQTREKKQRLNEQHLIKARELATRMNETSCTITVAAGEGDTLYGSVTATMIAEALAGEGFKIDKDQIELEAPIKKLGIYTVPICPAPDITARIKVWVVKE